MAKKKIKRSSSGSTARISTSSVGNEVWYVYLYEVITVPEGCTTYLVGDIVRVVMQENPPIDTITIGGTGPCAGTVLQYYGEP